MGMSGPVNLEDLMKMKARGVCVSEGSIAEVDLDMVERGFLEVLMKQKAREFVHPRTPSRSWSWIRPST